MNEQGSLRHTGVLLFADMGDATAEVLAAQGLVKDAGVVREQLQVAVTTSRNLFVTATAVRRLVEDAVADIEPDDDHVDDTPTIADLLSTAMSAFQDVAAALDEIDGEVTWLSLPPQRRDELETAFERTAAHLREAGAFSELVRQVALGAPWPTAVDPSTSLPPVVNARTFARVAMALAALSAGRLGDLGEHDVAAGIDTYSDSGPCEFITEVMLHGRAWSEALDPTERNNLARHGGPHVCDVLDADSAAMTVVHAVHAVEECTAIGCRLTGNDDAALVTYIGALLATAGRLLVDAGVTDPLPRSLASGSEWWTVTLPQQ
jgi:hypothetical protein